MNSEKLVQKLIKKCKYYEVVSFDVFDTLLKRDVLNPKDVFSLVEGKYYQKYAIHLDVFAKKRIKTEYDLRKARNLQEITLDEIYDALEYDQDKKQELKNLELSIERNVLHANAPLKRVYDYCINHNKAVYIISDMYLPFDFLEEVLKGNGYSGYKKLFLSCKYKKTKFTGELFKVFLAEEKLNAKQVLHIGDSLYADVIGARKVGLKNIRIQTNSNNTLYMSLPDENMALSKRALYAFVNSHEVFCKTRPEMLGYELLGPLIYGYCAFIHNLDDRKGRKVWMAARDMYLFEKAYKRLYPDDSCEYIYLSRKSLRPAYTDAVGDLSKAGEAFPDKDYSMTQVINYMGYMPEETMLSDKDIQSKKKYHGRSLGDYPEIRKAFDTDAIRQKENVLATTGKQYLDEHGLFSEDILLADVGWHGTIQLLLEKIREIDAKSHTILKGCYLGCCEGTSKRIGNTYKSWLFDENDDCPFMRGIVLLESMILAPHGSTKRYEKGTDGGIHPILGKPDNVSQTVQDIQNGAMRFVDDFSKSVLKNLIDIDPQLVSDTFEKFETEPLKEELEYIGNLDYENFDDTKIACPKSIVHYIIRPSDLKNDFMDSGWRTGFLYRLCGIRLPYAKLYDLGRLIWRIRNKVKSM